MQPCPGSLSEMDRPLVSSWVLAGECGRVPLFPGSLLEFDHAAVS